MELHKPKNLYELLTLNMEQRFANRVAFRWYDADQDVVVEKHFGEYAQDIRRAVNYYLSTIPDIQGKRVCVWSNNSYHYAVNCYGVMMAGGVIVPMNQRKSWDELHRELELVEPSAILTDGDDYGCNEEMQAAYGSLLRPMDAYKAYEPAELVNRIQPEELMVLMFTSGTTGRSKGVMLCERNFFAVMPHHVRVGQRFCQLKNDPDLLVSHMTLLPMFHLGAFGCLFTWAWMGWAQNLGSLRSFYKDLKRMPSQAMAAVPVLVQSIHHDLMTGKQGKLGDLWALNCMSAMFDPQTLMDLHDHGMVISQLYGSTETTGGGLINFAEDAKHIGSIGKDDGHCEIKLDNGELCMRGGDGMLGIGLRYVRFAAEERNLFHLLFQPGAFSGASLNDLVSSEELNPIIQALRQETGVTEDAAREIFSTLFVFVHGYASLLANNEMKLEEDQLTLSLKKVFFGAIYAEKEIENEGNI